jgi:anthraniloyl-CoA monooxygenase
MRFPLRIFDAVRSKWPNEKPISVRLSATDWVGEGGLNCDDAVEISRLLKSQGCDIINVSAGQTTPEAKPIYGRMFQVWLSEQVRLEASIPTITAGNITNWDQVNTILAAGRADLVAIGRPHLTNPHFTLQAAAYYGVKQQRWPLPYETGKEQSYRLSQREREEEIALQLASRPDSHKPAKG